MCVYIISISTELYLNKAPCQAIIFSISSLITLTPEVYCRIVIVK